MKIAITGQNGLAATTRQCCDRHFTVLSHLDPGIEILWVCYDTPFDDRSNPDYAWVEDKIHRDLFEVHGHPVVLISSQVPVGTCHRLEEHFPGFEFASSPENIRVAHATEDFMNQARVIVGLRRLDKQFLFEELFFNFTKRIIFTNPETAEMVKHALNCWLGMNIAYINEIAKVCEAVGADVKVVSEALLSERRISPKAPLKPGAPFGGGHLMRDILTVEEIARGRNITIPLISHIRDSNGDTKP